VSRKWAIGFAAVISITVIVAILWQRSAEPVYEGKKLREWLELNSSQVVESWNGEAESAIRQIGPRAVPWLLKWARCKTPAWRENLCSAYDKVPRRLRSASLEKRILGAEDLVLDVDLAWGFKTLGSQGASGIPDLMTLLNDPQRVRVAAMCLGKLGWVALPHVMKAFNDPATTNYLGLLEALNRMGNNAKPAVPKLIEGLKDTNATIAKASAEALGRLKLEPDLAVPALILGLEHSDSQIRIACVKALVGFTEKAQPAVPALVRCLREANVDATSEAAKALGELGLEAEQVVPSLPVFPVMIGLLPTVFPANCPSPIYFASSFPWATQM
jgi:hypothetical protein